MYTVYQAQPVISMLYVLMAKYECALPGSQRHFEQVPQIRIGERNPAAFQVSASQP